MSELILESGSATPTECYASRLGYAGLIPFVVLSALMFRGEWQQQAGQALVAYGAVIISFLGAWHWGSAVSGATLGNPARRLLFGVTPALIGWAALFLPLNYGLILIVTGLLLTYLADVRWGVTHAWYLRLRTRLTWVSTASVGIGLVSIL